MNENQRKQLLMDKCYEKGVKDTLQKVQIEIKKNKEIGLSEKNNLNIEIIKSIYVFDEKLIKKHHTHKGHHRKQDDKHFKFFEDLERAKTLLKIGEKN